MARNGLASSPLGDAALPTGTVSFLFTDIGGSTQRWGTSRDAMISSWVGMLADRRKHLANSIAVFGVHFCDDLRDALDPRASE
jgi:hypothetical protein